MLRSTARALMWVVVYAACGGDEESSSKKDVADAPPTDAAGDSVADTTVDVDTTTATTDATADADTTTPFDAETSVDTTTETTDTTTGTTTTTTDATVIQDTAGDTVVGPGEPAAGTTRTLDGLGHPLGAVTVVELGPGGARTLTTDAESGRVTLAAGGPGAYAWRFERDGHLSAWRDAEVAEGEVLAVPHPRLPLRDPIGVDIVAAEALVLEDEADRVAIVFDEDAFDEDGRAHLTPLDGQALPAFLPRGWSPLAAFRVDLDVEPGAPGNADVALDAPLAPGELATVVVFDEGTLRWITIASVPGGGTSRDHVAIVIPDAGTYAVVVPDLAPLAPPTPVLDAALAGVTAVDPAPVRLTASATFVPPSALASEDPAAVTTTLTVAVTAPQPVASGLVLGGRMAETYTLAGGARRTLPDYDTSLVAYTRPAATDPSGGHLRARTPVRPRLVLGPTELTLARVHVDVLARPEAAGALVPATGGRVDAPGVGLIVGALPGPEVVGLAPADPATLVAATGTTLPSGYVAVAGFTLDLGTTVPAGALALALAGQAPLSDLVLARVVTTGEHFGLEPVERLITNGLGVVSSAEPATGPRLPGLVRGGRYVVIRVPAPQGLVTGAVAATASPPRAVPVRFFGGPPWLAIAQPSFALVAPPGSHTLYAQDLATGDFGSAAVTITDVSIAVTTTITLAASGPRVIATDPIDGEPAAPAVTPVRVTFSEPVVFAADIVTLATADGALVPGVATLDVSGTLATFLPDDPLAPSTEHVVTVAAVVDRAGSPLEGPRAFRFTTRPAPRVDEAGGLLIAYPPGSLNHTCQDVPGFDPANLDIACVVGTQGTADPVVPVTIINDLTGATATVLSKPDGSFASFVAARVDEYLVASFVNRNGTVTTVPLQRQVFDDGSVALFASGGTLTADGSAQGLPGPIELELPPGAITGKSIFKIEAPPLEELAADAGGVEPAEARTVAGLRLSMGGDPFEGGMELAIPIALEDLGLPEGADPAEAGIVLTTPRVVDGVAGFQVLTELHYEDGKLVTTPRSTGDAPQAPSFIPIESPPSASLLGGMLTVLSVATDVYTLYAMVLSVLGPAYTSGYVAECRSSPANAYKCGILLESAIGSESRRAADALDTSIALRLLPGSIVTAIVEEGIVPDRPGALRPGYLFAVADEDALFQILVPVNQRDHVLIAFHPDFGPPASAPVTEADNVLGFGRIRKDLMWEVDPAQEALDAPPSLTVSHTPTRPETFGGVGLPTPTQAAHLTVVGRHPGFVPIVDPPMVLGVVALTPGQTGALSDCVPGLPTYVDGPLMRTMTVDVSCRIPALVKLHLRAFAGRPTERVYPIYFGAPPAPVPNPPAAPEPLDRTGPMVTWTWPVDEARGVVAGQPIEIRFNEPVDASIVSVPAALQLVTFGVAGAAPVTAELSPDQRTLYLKAFSLAPDKEYTLSLTSAITDLRGNAFDQDPVASGPNDFTLRFRTAPAPEVPLPGIGMGGGALVRGAYAFVLDRLGPLDGALLVYDLTGGSCPTTPSTAATPTSPGLVKAIDLPPFPRSMVMTGEYSFRKKAGAPVETKVLLAVVGGTVGVSYINDDTTESLSGQYQYLQIYDITDPCETRFFLGTFATLDATAVVSKVVWSPPHLAYLSKGASLETIELVDLQTLIIGQHLLKESVTPGGPSEWDMDLHTAEYPGEPGVDSNGDGDYVDADEELPKPARLINGLFVGGAFPGHERTVRVTDTSQPILDFTYDAALGRIGALLGQGRLNDPTGLPGKYPCFLDAQCLPLEQCGGEIAGRCSITVGQTCFSNGDCPPPAMPGLFESCIGAVQGECTRNGQPRDWIGAGYRTLMDAGRDDPDYLPRLEVFHPFAGEQLKRLFLAPGLFIAKTPGAVPEPVDLALVTALPDGLGAGSRLFLLDVTNVRAPALLGTIDVPAPAGLHPPGYVPLVQGVQVRDDGLLELATDRDVLLLDPSQLGAAQAPGQPHPAFVGLVPGIGGGLHARGSTSSGVFVSVDGDNQVVQTAPTLTFVSFQTAPAVLAPSTWSALSAAARKTAVDDALEVMRTEARLLPARFKAAAGHPSELTPPAPAVHYHVLVRAPGWAGASFDLGLESLGRSGDPYTPRGRGFAPVHALSAAAADDLRQGGAPRSCDAPVEPLKAWRLSDDKADPRFNLYLSDPIAFTYERMTDAEVAAVSTNRVVLWSGHAVRAFIDPDEDAPALAPFAAEITGGRLSPGASTVAETYPAEYVLGPNPSPVSGDMKLPGTEDSVSLTNRQMSLDTVDLTLPSPRMPIVFERSLRGQDLHEGPFGRGWDFVYNQRLAAVPEGAELPIVDRGAAPATIGKSRDIFFHNGAGHTILFKRHPGDTPPPEYANDPLLNAPAPDGIDQMAHGEAWYVPENGIFDALVRVKTGQLVRVTPDGEQYWYAADGRLEKIYDRYAANWHRLIYNQRGWLVRIEDESVPAERWLDVGWYLDPNDPLFRGGIDETPTSWVVSGKIRRLKDYTGREVLYSYNAEGQLTRFEGPEIQTVGDPAVAFKGRRRTDYLWDDCASGGSLKAHRDGSPSGAVTFSADTRAGPDSDRVQSGTGPTGGVTIGTTATDNTAAAIAMGTAQTSATDTTGAVTRVDLDIRGLPGAFELSGPSPQGPSTRRLETQHDEHHRLKRNVLPRGNVVYFEYEEAPLPLRARNNLRETRRDPGPVAAPDDGVITTSSAFDRSYNELSGSQLDANGNTFMVTLQNGGRAVRQVEYPAAGLRSIREEDATTGQLTRVVDFDGVERSYTYESGTGFLETETVGGANGPTTRYVYTGCDAGARGKPCRIEPPLGEPIIMDYDETDLVVREVRGAQRTTTSYDENGHAIETAVELDSGTPQRRRITRRVFDQTGFLEEETEVGVETDGAPLSLTTRYTPDVLKRVKEITLPGGERRTFEYDHLGHVTTMTLGTPGGTPDAAYTEEYRYDDNGNRTRVIIGDAETTLDYDGHDRLMRATSPLGDVAVTRYYGSGAVKSTTLDDHDATLGQLAAASMTIDPLDRPLIITQTGDAGPSPTTHRYHVSGQALERAVTGPRGSEQVTTYDASGRTKTVSVAGVYTRILTIDANMRLRQVESREGGAGAQGLDYGEIRDYDDLDRLVVERDSAGTARVTYTPRLDGVVEAIADGLGHVTATPHTVLGEPLARRLPSGVEFAWQRHDHRLMSKQGDGTGAGEVHEYDDLMRRTQTTWRDGGTSTWSDFDARGKPQAFTIPGGGGAVGYDKLGRPTATTSEYLAQAPRAETTTWDALNRPRTVTFPGGSVTYDYDLLGPVSAVTFTQPGGTYALGFTIDTDGSRSEARYPSFTVAEDRDVHGRLVGLRSAGADLMAGVSYTTAEAPGEWTLGPGGLIDVTATYDHRKRPLTKRYARAGRVLAEARYAWDAADRQVARQWIHRNGASDHLGWDDADRLTRADMGARPALAGEGAGAWAVASEVPGAWRAGDYARDYQYDAAAPGQALDLLTTVNEQRPPGVLASALPPFAQTRSSPDGWLHLQDVDGFARTRDPQGNVTRARLFPREPNEPGPTIGGVAATLTYNASGQLERVARDDGVVVEYLYRSDDLMFRRSVSCPTAPGACTPSDTGFVHDGMNLVEEYDIFGGGSALRKRYYYADESDIPVAADLWNGAALVRHYYLTDVQGSVMAVADGAGAVVERARYDAWGQATIERADTAEPRVVTITVVAPDHVRVSFSEPVLPPIDTAPGGFVTTLPDPLDGLELGGPDGSRAIAGATLDGPTLELTGITPALDPSLDYELTFLPDALIDTWMNPVAPGVRVFDGTTGFAGAPGDTGPETVARSELGSPFLFQGEWLDFDTGLVYLRARWYDPSLGQFLSPDPESYEDSVNPYAGFAQDPTVNRDPTGRGILSWALKAFGRLGGRGGRAVARSNNAARQAVLGHAGIGTGGRSASQVTRNLPTDTVKHAVEPVTDVVTRELVILAGPQITAMARHLAAARSAFFVRLDKLSPSDIKMMRDLVWRRVSVVGHGLTNAAGEFVGRMSTFGRHGASSGKEVAEHLIGTLKVRAKAWDLFSCGSAAKPVCGGMSFATSFYQRVKMPVRGYTDLVLDKGGQFFGAVRARSGTVVEYLTSRWHKAKRALTDIEVDYPRGGGAP
ncbi:MAG: Ig-like domain-containing protein [Deltaproteobacteria bacterium]|nr:Ig-like domain-containing protein [Deltaproteobacteria bacterium]